MTEAQLRPAAEILLIAVEEFERVLDTAADDLDLPTPCEAWSLRDVVAHCSGSLLRAVENRLHLFTPADNQIDVEERRSWPFADVRTELEETAGPAASIIDAAGGKLDGIGLGVWVHAGDIREAIDLKDAYAGPGLDLGLALLAERSERKLPFALDVDLGERNLRLGIKETDPVGTLTTDADTLVRLTAGRQPLTGLYQLSGVAAAELALFS